MNLDDVDELQLDHEHGAAELNSELKSEIRVLNILQRIDKSDP